jgi:hypothetical protein
MKSTLALLLEAVQAQQAWMTEHGGTRSGYIARYGSVDNSNHYGNGGDAIFDADNAELQQRIARYEQYRRRQS